ncbi:alpha-amylase family glycosyl hydrolase [Coralloluteibacterium stylophorae]|uniref:Alpha-glucosidase n=1 Tax=Coralloluteibacterium stylophorae TaxID=1776034 RepID=A0A8J7VTX0_9GAMM|nr:alpha-amylase family glycosyl hydrolase [Coralloluteibacterium stylophorae]MBS7455739.1 alpha-glucosidase [Coralloluteibacterium stylophorae]
MRSPLRPKVLDAWWRGAVIYQVYPRSFADSNGDGVGDLPGITARLEHIAALGCDAVWISPFFRSPMRDFGYDIADYRDVDPLFGTLADFDALVERAHALGLKVLIDQVLSHTSDLHPWFVESRASRDNAKADWYVWADPKPDGSPPNNWLAMFGGGAWQWESRRRQYFFHGFLASQPDLNFHHPEVQAAVLDVVRFWCERGVDGFRFDACNNFFHDAALADNPVSTTQQRARTSTVRRDNPFHLQWHVNDKSRPENLAFLERLRGVLDEYGVASIGEIGDEDAPPLMADYTAAGRRLHMAYSFQLLQGDGSAARIREEVELLERELARTGGWGCWALSNHDVTRVATRWAPGGAVDDGFSRLLLTLLCCLRGSVCLYQGEELGLPEVEVPFERLQDPYGIAFWPEFPGRDGCRTPMPWVADAVQCGFTAVEPWLPLAGSHAERAVDRQEADPRSTLRHVRRLLAWRRDEPRLRVDDIRFHEAPEGVLLFERGPLPRDPLQPAPGSLVLMFNLGGDRVLVPRPALLRAATPFPDAPVPPAGTADDDPDAWVLAPHSAAVAQLPA